MKTIEKNIYSLCAQIDQLQEEVIYWRELYEKERLENIKVSKERLIQSQQGIADALMLCLSVKDMPDGSLVIDKEERKELAKHFDR